MSIISRLSKVLFLLTFLFSHQAFSQNTASVQLEDYVILQNGRRFDGTVLRKLGQKDFEKIEFLRRGETEVYSPEDIQSFGLGTGEFFRSMFIPNNPEKRFIQIYFEGEIILGRYQDDFFAGSAENLDQLKDSESKGSQKPYKLTLKELMKGECQKRVSSLIRGSNLNEEELIWLFSKYYACKGGEFSFYGETRPPFIFSPVVSLSVYESGIQSHIVVGERKDLLSSSPVIQGYLGMSIHTIRRYPRISAEAGLAYETSTFTWESQYENSSGRYTGTEEMGHSLVSLPLTINYSIYKTRNKDFFVGIGGGYGVSSSSSDFAIQDLRSVNSVSVGLKEGSFTSTKNGTFFYHAQAGFLVNLKSSKALTVAVKFRQIGDYYSVVVGPNTAHYHKLDFGVGVGFRF